MKALKSGEAGMRLKELSVAKILGHRVGNSTDRDVIGSKGFVDQAFAASRDRFSPESKDGAEKSETCRLPQLGSPGACVICAWRLESSQSH